MAQLKLCPFETRPFFQYFLKRCPFHLMQIIEIYKSLQGESSYAGLPCVFVRTAGCNLRCVWCDSEYTFKGCLLYTSPSPRDRQKSRMPSSA